MANTNGFAKTPNYNQIITWKEKANGKEGRKKTKYPRHMGG
jgi:hypothetical protein